MIKSQLRQLGTCFLPVFLFSFFSTVQTGRFYVGQNIATTWSTWEKSSEPDFPSQIKAWFNEVDTYSFSGGFNHETGHYSQVCH